MAVLNEGEVVCVLDVDVLIECTVISFYPFNEITFVTLKGIGNGKKYVRPLSVFIKPDKAVPKFSEGGNH